MVAWVVVAVDVEVVADPTVSMAARRPSHRRTQELSKLAKVAKVATIPPPRSK